MGQPKAGTPATIAQQGDTLTLIDRGDWFTQDDGTAHLNRTCLEWQRQLGGGGWEPIGASCPAVKRTPWDSTHEAEIFRTNTGGDGKWTGELKIGPENAGRKFRALVMAGYGPSANDGQDWVEWGAGSGATGELVYSNTLTVTSWAQPQPEPPAKPTGDTLAHDSLVLAKRAIGAWQDKGIADPKIHSSAAWVQVAYRAATPELKAQIVGLLEDAA